MRQDEIESIYLRMDPMDVAVLRAWEGGGLRAAALALRSQTALGTKYRHSQAVRVLEHMLREPRSTGESVEEIMRSAPFAKWTVARRSLLCEFLVGASSMHHLCRLRGRKTNEGVYIRGRLRAIPPQLSEAAREWLAWRQAMPFRYPGMDGIRVTHPHTVGPQEALLKLEGTTNMSLAGASRALGVNENTVRKWRARAAGRAGI